MKSNKSKIITVFIKVFLTLFYSYCIYIVSSRDTSSVPLFPHIDKLIHFIEFGILGFMMCWVISSFGMKTKIFFYLLAIGITSLYGASDEIHQFFTPHRSMDILDWLSDTLGATTAVIAWQRIMSRRHIRKKLIPLTNVPRQ
ncbi:MAG: VanZ family protein [Candidatus Brocadiaceae bacterium]|nr:VanZ family protein [Candidatus Brocadiaceae bacterium]